MEPVFSKLKNEFVVGWRNIITEKYVGESAGYTCDQTSVGTTNGAGPHNVQIFVLAPDLTVLHCLPGFWHPDDLAQELDLARKLLRVWQDESLSRKQKNAKFTEMQLAAWKNASRKTTARSGWQGFDAANEQKRVLSGKTRDTMLTNPGPMPPPRMKGTKKRGKKTRRRRGKMKPINQLVHERISQRPFVAYADFDTAEFADYGRVLYDNNRRVDGKGQLFMTPRKVAKAEAREARRQAALKRRQEANAKRRARRDAQRKAQRARTAQRRARMAAARNKRLMSNRRTKAF